MLHLSKISTRFFRVYISIIETFLLTMIVVGVIFQFRLNNSESFAAWATTTTPKTRQNRAKLLDGTVSKILYPPSQLRNIFREAVPCDEVTETDEQFEVRCLQSRTIPSHGAYG